MVEEESNTKPHSNLSFCIYRSGAGAYQIFVYTEKMLRTSYSVLTLCAKHMMCSMYNVPDLNSIEETKLKIETENCI